MYDLLVALLSMGNRLNKRQLLITISLYLNYKALKDKNNIGKAIPIGIKDISRETGIDSHATGLTIDSLANFNIIGTVILNNEIPKRKVIKGLSETFVRGLGDIAKGKSINKIISIAVNNAKYYIPDESKVYIFNPDFRTWEYPNWTKLSKYLNGFKNKFISELVNYLIRAKKNGKKNKSKAENKRLNASHLIKIFMAKFQDTYSKEYPLQGSVEGRRLKTLIIQFERNGFSREEIPDFLDWAFEKQKKAEKVLHIGFLRYMATKYMINKDKSKKPQFDTDIDGNKRRRTE